MLLSSIPCDVSPLYIWNSYAGAFHVCSFSLLLVCFYCFGFVVYACIGCNSNRSLPPAARKLTPLSEQNLIGVIWNECHKLGSHPRAFPRPNPGILCALIPRICGYVSSSVLSLRLISFDL